MYGSNGNRFHDLIDGGASVFGAPVYISSSQKMRALLVGGAEHLPDVAFGPGREL
jgi:hypothetical protein